MGVVSSVVQLLSCHPDFERGFSSLLLWVFRASQHKENYMSEDIIEGAKSAKRE